MYLVAMQTPRGWQPIYCLYEHPVVAFQQH